MHLKKLNLAIILAFTTIYIGCATAPWEGMSETEITAWNAAGVSPQTAKQYEAAGINPDLYTVWLENEILPQKF